MTLGALHDMRGGSGPKAGPAKSPSESSGLTWDDPLLYALAFVIGLVPVIAVLVRGTSWGGAPTVGILFCISSGGALMRHVFGTPLAVHRRPHAAKRSRS